MRSKKKNVAAVTLGRLGGIARAKVLTDDERKESASRAGKARAAQLSAEKRSAIAKKAVAAREAKRAQKRGAR